MMKKRKYFLIVLLIWVNAVYSQNLNDKKHQLEEIKKNISEQEKIIKEKEQIKKKKASALNIHKKKKKTIDKKLTNLKYLERKIKKKLKLTQDNLTTTKKHIKKVDKLINAELEALLWEDIDVVLQRNDLQNPMIIADMINQSSDKLDKYNDRKNLLTNVTQKTSTSYKKVKKKKKLTLNKKYTYEKKIKKLQTDIKKISKEEKEAIAEKKRLENTAQELNDLINKLQMDLTQIDYDYKFSKTLIWPLKGEIIKYFGLQKNKKYKKINVKNNGIDIKTASGSKVHAIYGGVVAFANIYAGQGKLVIINHKNGFYSLYSYNSKILVSKGDDVKAGQVIALSGDSGQTEIPALHFELRKRGTPVNPLDYLK